MPARGQVDIQQHQAHRRKIHGQKDNNIGAAEPQGQHQQHIAGEQPRQHIAGPGDMLRQQEIHQQAGPHGHQEENRQQIPQAAALCLRGGPLPGVQRRPGGTLQAGMVGGQAAQGAFFLPLAQLHAAIHTVHSVRPFVAVHGDLHPQLHQPVQEIPLQPGL